MTTIDAGIAQREVAVPVALPLAGEPGALRGAARRFALSNAVAEDFFRENADAIAVACRAMAGRFQKGGRLFVCGDGAQRSDALHVVVEFVHPVVVGKRALPAIALPDIESGAAQRALDALGRRGDVLLLLSAGGLTVPAREVLSSAHDNGVLTLELTGSEADVGASPHGSIGPGVAAGHRFAVPSMDPCIVQETHEILYHVLWELVHVFFEHRAVSA